jgi:hypothetical protein
LFDDVVVGLNFGFTSCFFVVVLRLGAIVTSNFFDRLSLDSSRDVLLFCGDRAVVTSSPQAAGLFFGRIENRKPKTCQLEKSRILSCERKQCYEKSECSVGQ